MALSNQKVWFGIRADDALARVGVTGTPRVGFAKAQVVDMPLVTDPYAFKATATGAGQTATLVLSSGQVTGTATFEDEGVDFEGETLPTMTKVHAILIVAGDSNTGNVTIASSTPFPDCVLKAGQSIQMNLGAAGEGFASESIQATIADNGDDVTVYILASI